MKKYPIIIFSYNRPIHLYRMLLSLEKCKDVSKYPVYFFCDGPKNDLDKKKIFEIQKIVNKKFKFKFKKKIFRKRNFGLAKNIIRGVSLVLRNHKACIVIEDDLKLGKHALEFINHYLNVLKAKDKIGSVSSYSYLNQSKKFREFENYITKRHCSWCWGTWSRVWKQIEWEKINYKSHFNSKNKQLMFNEAGNDLNLMLWGQYKKYINSWAIRFNYHCFKNKLKSLHPRFTMVNNLGSDFSGTHELFKFNKSLVLNFVPNLKKNINNKTSLSDKKSDVIIKSNHRKSFRLSFMKVISNVV